MHMCEKNLKIYLSSSAQSRYYIKYLYRQTNINNSRVICVFSTAKLRKFKIIFTMIAFSKDYRNIIKTFEHYSNILRLILHIITKPGKIITRWGSSKITKRCKKFTKPDSYYEVGKNYEVGYNTRGLGISKNTFQIKISLEKHMN